MIPTIKEVMKYYTCIAKTERMKTGQPSEGTVANVLRGTRLVCQAAGVSRTQPLDILTRAKLDLALANFCERGIARITALSYLYQLRGLLARWCRPYYEDAGWQIPDLCFPAFRAKPPRYVRPSVETLRRVKSWYGTLRREKWFVATMMLDLGMRNGDILRLKDENFIQKGNRHYLLYTPHKTELSSGRRVCWPIHDAIWLQLTDYGGLAALDITEETFDALNNDLRGLGFGGSKAAYELRKICIDHIYQRCGVEMAVAISGDDIKTISRYYADPAQPNAESIRVSALL